MTEEMTSSSRPISLTIIAATTQKNGIGVNGTLPWRLPKEMAHFRKATSATGSSSELARNAVVMGRKTWESIPPKFRPLKGRVNVVISRSSGKESEAELGIQGEEDTYLTSSLDAAAELLQKLRPKPSRTFLIGGAQLYTQAMETPLKAATLDRLLITRIFDPAFEECDVFLPEFRDEMQKSQDSGNADHLPAESASEWRRCSDSELDAFMGDPIEKGNIEEKGVKYQLQMWQRKR